MAKRKIGLFEMMRLMSSGRGRMRFSRALSVVGSDKIHMDIEIHLSPPAHCDEIELNLHVAGEEEGAEEELDVEDVADDGGSLHYLPGCGDPGDRGGGGP